MHNKLQLPHSASQGREHNATLGGVCLADWKHCPPFLCRTCSAKRNAKDRPSGGCQKAKLGQHPLSPSETPQEAFLLSLCLQSFCEAAFMTLPSQLRHLNL